MGGGGHNFALPSIGVGRPNTVVEGHSAFPRTKISTRHFVHIAKLGFDP